MVTIEKRRRTGRATPESPGELPAKRPSASQFRFDYLVHDVSRVRRTVMDQVMRPYGITRSQWSVLSALSRGGNDGLMQVDLARLTEVGKVTVGGLIDRLRRAAMSNAVRITPIAGPSGSSSRSRAFASSS